MFEFNIERQVAMHNKCFFKSFLTVLIVCTPIVGYLCAWLCIRVPKITLKYPIGKTTPFLSQWDRDSPSIIQCFTCNDNLGETTFKVQVFVGGVYMQLPLN